MSFTGRRCPERDLKCHAHRRENDGRKRNMCIWLCLLRVGIGDEGDGNVKSSITLDVTWLRKR